MPDLLPISALQHLLYSERQCTLIHLEQVWAENQFTMEGKVLHEKAHEGADETKADVRIARGLAVKSEALGLSGQYDVVEFQPVGTRCAASDCNHAVASDCNHAVASDCNHAVASDCNHAVASDCNHAATSDCNHAAASDLPNHSAVPNVIWRQHGSKVKRVVLNAPSNDVRCNGLRTTLPTTITLLQFFNHLPDRL